MKVKKLRKVVFKKLKSESLAGSDEANGWGGLEKSELKGLFEICMQQKKVIVSGKRVSYKAKKRT